MTDFDIDKWMQEHVASEPAAANPLVIKEVGGSARVAEVDGKPEKRMVTLITEGWGSSGFYSREVLKEFGPKAFPIGTHMFINHPTATEEMDRPERSVTDLAAVISSTPHMVGGELVAEAEVKPHWQQVIDGLANDIGLSIRARGESVHGEVNGRSGEIITQLVPDEFNSVDFVTRAGRGGKIGQLIESARRQDLETMEEARNVGEWLEAFIHRTFTMRVDDGFGEGFITRDERKLLSSAIGKALDAFHAAVESNAPQLLTRDPFAEPGEHETDTTETSRSGGTNKEVTLSDESKLSELGERLSQLETKVTDTEQKLDESETARKEAEKRADRAEDKLKSEAAERIVSEAFDSDDVPDLPKRAAERVRKTVLEADLPEDRDGNLIKTEIIERVKKEAKDEHDYLTEGSTAGRVSDVDVSNGGTPVGESDDPKAAEKLEESFKRLGMSDEAAKTAAAGR